MDYTNLLKEIKKKLKKEVPYNRYSHVKRVAKLSVKLALRYSLDSKKAQIAAMSHDLARHWSKEKQLKYISKRGFEISEIEKENPYMLHGLVAALMLQHRWGYHDEDVFNAVRFHTTGRGNMSDLEKLLYLSDSVEPGRKHIKAKTRKELNIYSLDEMLYKVVKRGRKFRKKQGKPLHPWTDEMYRQLKEIHKRENR